MEPTCSAIFLLRLLEIDRKDLRNKELGFINCFMRDDSQVALKGRHLYLLFKPIDMESFTLFVELEKERTPHFIQDYDYPGGYCVLIYQLPVRFEEDYKLFDEGKYSKFSKEMRDVYSKDMRAYDIVNKAKVMIDYWTEKTGYDFSQDDELELWSKPDLDSETLKIDQIYAIDKHGNYKKA